MIHSVLITLILILSYNAFGQTTKPELSFCPQISLQHLKLDISISEVEQKLSAKLNLRAVHGLPIGDFAQTTLINIKSKAISLYFYKNQLYRISVTYDQSERFTGISSFTKLLSKTLNLTQPWRYVGWSPLIDFARIDCPSYNLYAMRRSNDYIATVEDVDISEKEKASKL